MDHYSIYDAATNEGGAALCRGIHGCVGCSYTSHRCSHRTVSMPDGMPAGQQGTFRTPIVGIGAAKPASRTSPCGLRPRPIPGISWRTPAKVSRRTCHEETMVANKGNQTGSLLDSGRPRSHVVSCEVNHAGSLLHRCPDCFLCPDVGVYQGVGTPLMGRIKMEYAIAGVTAIFLFVYLMYALLRPERF